MSLKAFAKRITPPILADLVRGLTRTPEAGPGEFQVVGASWPRDSLSNPGWNDDAIARAHASRWPAFVSAIEAPAPMDTPHEVAEVQHPNMAFHNTYMSYGYVLGVAAWQRESLSILDWGGGVGNYYAAATSMFPALALDYHCKDLPAFCREGRKLLPNAHFYEDDSCLSRRYDLVMASGSLQCSPDWRSVSAGLAAAADPYLYITRLPILVHHESSVVRQHAAVHGFNDDLLGWFLNRRELIEHIEGRGLELMREFYVDERPYAPAIREIAQYRGFLFRRP